ncbi:oxalate/formate antiporter [Bordetella ansorpii]|uniref:Oxalate/formate antiporter n=1 Tax=Bordetella ansorpii TaxID=288768 RepID=A0A157SUA4_9BORD|nr:MFS transporter [Bordetella ansorpii]SAI73935.1 oxalate/formate antiporter [Bordetella ansorpii]
MRLSSRTSVVAALGTTQTLAWASSYYLPAMLSAPMGRDLGIAVPTVFAAFSFALLISAFLGPYAGKAIDRWGGRPVLMATNLIFALGLGWLGAIQSTVGLFAAWAVLGIGMGSGLYEAAFASLVRLYGQDSRSAISGITLIAGFASTVGWPLTSFLQVEFGWREACFVWAGLHLTLALPLNYILPSPAATAHHARQQKPRGEVPKGRSTWSSIALAVVFAITWFISTALAAHLPRLLVAAGATFAAAVAAGALMGPAQVGARILEFGLLRRVHPLLSARLATLTHPIGAILLLCFGAPLASAFVILHGAGNGILTIAKGTLPLVIFGPQGYGARQGMLMVPARVAQALAPWLFGLCLDRWGAGALWVSIGLSAIGFLALISLHAGSKDKQASPSIDAPTHGR